MTEPLVPKRPSESATEMVQVVLPNDANPLGYILGGTVMHLIDIAGAIASHRHARTPMVTAAVDGLQFLRLLRSKEGLQKIPVAIVTGDYFLDDAVSRELSGLGAEVRFKPLWLEDLLALARNLLKA